MSQGNIVAWKKKEGDAVQPGDVLCEVETDKATMEWEAQEEGFLAKIIMPEGSKDIPLGQIVAILVEDEADIAAFKNYSPDTDSAAASNGGGASVASSSSETASSPPPPPSSLSSSANYPSHDLLTMPALSPTMSSGNIMSWNKKEGDEVLAGDVLAEVETDKATMEWEAQEDGFVAKILVDEGSKDVPIGVPVLVLVTDKQDISAFKDFNAASAGAAAAPPKAVSPAPAAPSTPPPSPSKAAAAAPKPRQQKQAISAGGRIIASPYAQKLAAQAGVALARIGGGSGPNGRIIAADVEQFIASGGAGEGGGGPVPSDSLFTPYTDISNSQIRKVTAKRLLESKQQVPHYYLTISARIDQLMTVRKQLNDTLAASSKEGGVGKLSLNDFVIKAAALACKRVPEVNASWQGDFIRQYNTVDCSVAVQTPLGLMVPIIKDADSKGLAQIAADVKDLAGRAKAGKLKPEEFTGGTFTVSNLGMFGISQFAAIVNPPQAAILAIGAGLPKVVPASNGAAGQQFETGTFMQCTLSCDHRVVDGAVGAQWLAAFKGYLENPATMLLG